MHRWVQDKEISRSIGLRQAPSLAKTEAWIATAIADPCTEAFAILVSGMHVGNVVLDKIDGYLESARLSIYIGEPDHLRAGVGLTALHQVAEAGFNRLHLHKIWLTVHTCNHSAIRTYINVGFSIEGVLRDEFWLDGRRTNVFYMGLLKGDLKEFGMLGGIAHDGAYTGHSEPESKRT